MRGHDVRVLQDFLTIAGFPVKVSGYFGPGTLHSVMAFQRAHKMVADGVVTTGVERAIRRVVVIKIANSKPRPLTINPNGTATAPVGAPPAVRAMIAAGNRIINTSYCYAGGHGSWNDSCYDCSGSVSYVLHAAGMLGSPEDSTGLESWGSPGRGRWVTVYANASHTWIAIAGRAFDTADFGGPDIPGGSGPRWRWNPTGNFGDGMSYVARHPAGL
jgi:peptidoglycan hydrolase-like protein with peptidoglycan-binding domain